VISLKKHIDAMDATFREGFLSAYRSLLHSVATWGPRAVPDLGDMLTQRLALLDDQLAESFTETLLSHASKQAEIELYEWADQAHKLHETNGREIREILTGVTSIAESIGRRDQTCGREIAGLMRQLEEASQSNDIAEIRRSIVASTTAITAVAVRLEDEGQASLTRLAAEIDGYRARLKTSQQLSWKDPLTGLSNRRCFDEQLKSAIHAGRPFCLVMVDLNGFKSVNDNHGHLVGDELLKQFANELRSQFPLASTVARWGGDEFAVILNSGIKDTEARVHRLQRWAVGDYLINRGRESIRISIDAAFGSVEWNPGESAKDLVIRADRCLYESKEALKATQPL
jgi:diguanylate cyclase